MADDYEIDGESCCPSCGHSPLHYRDCTNLSCEDGYEDESEDDPINFMPGELLTECPECRGTGVEWWCPSCGENLSGKLVFLNEEDEA
jgi:hypothetical protein